MYKSMCRKIKSNMISFDFKKIHFSFTFGFFFIVAFVCASGSVLTIYSFLFCIVHELAHLYAMKEYGVSVNDIAFYGAGIKISSEGIWALTRLKRVAIYLAGCLANALIALVYFVIQANELCVINLCLALLNILPISSLDGGKILQTLLPRCEMPLKVLSAVTSVSLVVCSVFAIVCFNDFSLTSLVVTAFVFLMSLIAD